jgi:hypothetical protein
MLNVKTARFIISEIMRYAIGLDVTLSNHKKVAGTTFLLVVLAVSTVSVSFGLQSSSTISSAGMINYWPRVDITVNVSKVIGVNNLSLGFQLDWHRWKTFIDSPVQRQLAQDAGFRLVRVFDFRPTNPRLMPCTYWNESTKTGTWNWTNVDALVLKVFEIGAEPLFCLGWARDNIQKYIPPGMAVNPTTLLPYPDSYAAYASEWVRHFKQLGLPVRFYQIMNEPYFYFGWNPSDTTKLAYYVELWNTVAKTMRKENPNILLSHDAITQKNVFSYWIEHGDDVDFLDFHKYDCDTLGKYSDAEMFNRAEIRGFEDVSWSALLSISTARQRWFNARGKWLPAIISESNFNSAWDTGTDPKIQQMTGAVWLALVLRMGVLKGLNYNIYFEFSSSKSWELANRPSGGWGFGMINEDDNQPWYPYYVQKIIGRNLNVGDKLVAVNSSSTDIKTLAWVSIDTLNILVVSTVGTHQAVFLNGVKGELSFFKIDDTISWETPSLQTGVIDSAEPLVVNGYTVILLQISI